MEGYVPLAPLLAILATMLALSIVVERFLMIFSWLVDRFWVLKVSMEWDGTKALEERLALAQRALAEERILDAPPNGEADPRDNDPTEIEAFPVAGAAPEAPFRFALKNIERPGNRGVKVLKEFYLQILSALVAIFICVNAEFSAFALLAWEPGAALMPPASTPAFWEYLLTGIMIGAGSKPVHILIEFLMSRKVRITREQEQQPTAPAPAPAPVAAAPSMNGTAAAVVPVVTAAPPTLEAYTGFHYDGGDRPARLEHTHLRRKPADLIVYHHTAMHADSPFSAIVEEFDRKNWLTGYHCIVFKDGTVRVLCRWDRTGNHARPCNFRSLGVALHGNFEPNPRVPASNPDGRFGIQHPTPAQLDAAARVVALWSHLYDIPPLFPAQPCSALDAAARAENVRTATGIVPHCHIAAKACPGSNFPHDAFQRAVLAYHDRWEQDADFKHALARFSDAPMLV